MTEQQGSAAGPDAGAPSSQTTNERLLIGAAELFRQRGYAGTTTRALSAMAGIQNASLYHHVGGKEDLLYRLCMRALDDVTEVFAQVAAADDPLVMLENLALGYVKQALRDRDRHATMLTEIRSLSPERRAEVIGRRDQNVKVVEDVINQAQDAGKVRRDIDKKYLALALFNMLNWTIFWFDPEGGLDEQVIGQILWSVFSVGTRSEEPVDEGPAPAPMRLQVTG